MPESLKALKKQFKNVTSTFVPLSRMPTGIIGLDLITGGGLPLGRITEIAGPESSGKSAFAAFMAKQSLAQGEGVVYLDLERTLATQDFDRCGVNALSDDFIYFRPANGEDALSIVVEACAANARLVVVDSVPFLMPKKIMEEADVGEVKISPVARLLGNEMARLVQAADNSNTIVLLINQLRTKVGQYGNPNDSYGGNALRYMCSLRLRIQQKGVLTEPAGITSQIKLLKSKISAPRESTEFDIYAESGLEPASNLRGEAQVSNVIIQRGAHFNWHPEFAETNKLDPKIGQGTKKVMEVLQDPEIYNLVYQAVLDGGFDPAV